MELRYDEQVSLKLLMEIEQIIMADSERSMVISSVGECEFDYDNGHVFKSLVLEYNPTKTDKVLKVLELLKEWTIKHAPVYAV